MSMLNPHDWRLDSDDEGKPRVHVRSLGEPSGPKQDCIRFTCLRCQHELYVQRVGYRQPPKYGCQGGA